MKNKLNLTTKILIGLIAGIIIGLLFTSNPAFLDTFIKPVGTLFINLIKLVIVPLVLASLIVGAASIGDPKKLGRIGGKTLSYYLLTTAFAVTIGLVLGKIFNPGAGLSIPTDAAAEATVAPKLIDTVLNIVPSNPLKAIVDGNMLQIIVFALLLGIAVTMLPKEKGKPFVSFFESLLRSCTKLLQL